MDPSQTKTVKHRVESLPIRGFRVDVLEGPDAGKGVEARGESLSIGTAEDNDLVLKDPTVSRYHVELQAQGDRILAIDHGSTNGTVAGGVRIERGDVPTGIVLSLGRTRVRVADGEAKEVELLDGFGELRGRSAPMRKLMALAEKAAQSQVAVLLIGESGTGKELIARAIHENGPRAKHPFVTVDCGSLSPTLISSELFGHERGAFTGAEQQHAGAFERAQGGTLFLDEIGELPLSLQPALLGVLERKTFRRLGGKTDLTTAARVVAATNRDLRAEVNSGKFRLDLYFRLAVLKLDVPPLRQRREDVPLLVAHFLEQLGIEGKIDSVVPYDDMQRLKEHAWPGNVRELRNFVEASAALGAIAPLEHSEVAAQVAKGELLGPGFDGLLEAPYRQARQAVIDQVEARYLKALLERAKGNIAQAARLAKMDRSHLFDLLDRHKLR
ncbi:MAG: sigma 54-dependent Fis family transcriptional regulator [Myxococcaceae bacterium]|nr:sigma 54-dependent Fis family transcriptional regulator [Myxococcaceae bacterium]